MNQIPQESEKKKILNVIKIENPQVYENPKDDGCSSDDMSGPELSEGGDYKTGRWHPAEHVRFIKGCLQYGNNWKKVKECVKTRSSAQIRSHAQKYIIKLCKKFNIQDNKQLKSFKNIKRKFTAEMGCDNLLSDLKSDTEDISGCSMEQIEEMILGIFKNNSGTAKKVMPLNIDNLNFGYDDADSIDSPAEEKKNKVFETVKEPKTKQKKSKNLSSHSSGGYNNPSNANSNMGMKNNMYNNYLGGAAQTNLQGMNDDNLNLLLAGITGMPPMGNLQNINNFANLPNFPNMPNMPNLHNFNNNIFPANQNNFSNDNLMQLWNSINNSNSPLNSKQNENLYNSLISALLTSEGTPSDDMLASFAKSMGMNIRPEDLSANINLGIPAAVANPQLPSFPNHGNNIQKTSSNPNSNEKMMSLNALGLGGVGGMMNGNMSEHSQLLSSLGMGDLNMDLLMASLLGGGGLPGNTSNGNNLPMNMSSSNLNNIAATQQTNNNYQPGSTHQNLNPNLPQNQIASNMNVNENLMQMFQMTPHNNSEYINNNPSSNNINNSFTPGNFNKSALDTDCSGQGQNNKNTQNPHTSQTGKENSVTITTSQPQGQINPNATEELNSLQQFSDVLKIITGAGNNSISTSNPNQNANSTHIPLELNNSEPLPKPTLKSEDPDNLSQMNNLNSLLMNPMKPNENILGEDNSMNMILNFLNNGGNNSVDLNNLMQLFEMNSGNNVNPLAMMSQTQQMPQVININSQSSNNIIQNNNRKNGESSQKDLDKTLEEKEDSLTGNKSQKSNNNINMMNNPFAYMNNPNDNNFNMNLGLSGMPMNNMNMNNNLLNDPIFGMMNQFLMSNQQPQQMPNTMNNMPGIPGMPGMANPNYGSKPGMDNFFLNNFNPMDFYNMDPSLMNPNLNMQPNSNGANLK